MTELNLPLEALYRIRIFKYQVKLSKLFAHVLIKCLKRQKLIKTKKKNLKVLF